MDPIISREVGVSEGHQSLKTIVTSSVISLIYRHIQGGPIVSKLFCGKHSHRIALNCHRDSQTWVWLLWVEYLPNALVDLGV